MVDVTRVLIMGASSVVGQAVCRLLAKENCELVLVARDKQKLSTIADDLVVRGASVKSLLYDMSDISKHEDLINEVGEIDIAYLFYGTLPDQARCEQDWESIAESLNTNFVSAASLLSRIANQFERRKQGSIVVVSSVAGDRGRKSNYVYGTAKGALSLFCAGLRNRLFGSGVNVLTVKPGFIDTPMTDGIEKKPAILWATPEKVAEDIIRAKKRNKDILYTPWFWRYILGIICIIPESIFKKMSL